jgi:hypothetical protein
MKNGFVILFFFMSSQIFAQTSAYHGIIFPYDTGPYQTIGGYIAAIPDFISGAQTNPAGLSFFKSPLLFFNIQQKWLWHELNFDPGLKSISNSDYNIYPGQFSGLIPIKINNKEIALGLVINKIQAPYFENIEPSIKDDNLKMNHSREGLVWTSTIGISSHIYNDLSIGLSFTKWFGHWQWHDDFPESKVTGDGQFSYNGYNLSMGLLQHFKKISFGLALYSPFVLMKADQIHLVTSWSPLIKAFDLEQQFKGGVRFGMAYNANSRLLLGAGYRYQGKIVIKDILKHNDGSLYTFKNNNSESHQINIGGQYGFLFKQIQLPIFFSYQATWLPKVQTYNYFDYQQVINDKRIIFHIIIMGFNINYQNYALYIAAQWNSAQKFPISNELASPFS